MYGLMKSNLSGVMGQTHTMKLKASCEGGHGGWDDLRGGEVCAVEGKQHNKERVERCRSLREGAAEECREN